jgi:ribosomal protein L16 Arg81 hydroxylase
LLQSLNFSLPNSYSPADFNKPRIWLGPKGSITPLHKDIVDNFCYHLYGIKRWRIFPVRDYPYLYMKHPDPENLPDFATSLVDLRSPDLLRFPLFQNAQPIVFDVMPGETLYLPAGWSHYVETQEDSLMVNLWLKRHRSPAVIEYADE